MKTLVKRLILYHILWAFVPEWLPLGVYCKKKKANNLTLGLFLSPTTTMHQSFLYKNLLTASCFGGAKMVVTTPHFVQFHLDSEIFFDLITLSRWNFLKCSGKVRNGNPLNSWPDVAWDNRVPKFSPYFVLSKSFLVKKFFYNGELHNHVKYREVPHYGFYESNAKK